MPASPSVEVEADRARGQTLAALQRWKEPTRAMSYCVGTPVRTAGRRCCAPRTAAPRSPTWLQTLWAVSAAVCRRRRSSCARSTSVAPCQPRRAAPDGAGLPPSPRPARPERRNRARPHAGDRPAPRPAPTAAEDWAGWRRGAAPARSRGRPSPGRTAGASYARAGAHSVGANAPRLSAAKTSHRSVGGDERVAGQVANLIIGVAEARQDVVHIA